MTPTTLSLTQERLLFFYVGIFYYALYYLGTYINIDISPYTKYAGVLSIAISYISITIKNENKAWTDYLILFAIGFLAFESANDFFQIFTKSLLYNFTLASFGFIFVNAALSFKLEDFVKDGKMLDFDRPQKTITRYLFGGIFISSAIAVALAFEYSKISELVFIVPFTLSFTIFFSSKP
jgi:hypothetical protein